MSRLKFEVRRLVLLFMKVPADSADQHYTLQSIQDLFAQADCDAESSRKQGFLFLSKQMCELSSVKSGLSFDTKAAAARLLTCEATCSSTDLFTVSTQEKIQS